MLNGLVLFAKTGGSTLALEDIVRPVAYHEPRRQYEKYLLNNLNPPTIYKTLLLGEPYVGFREGEEADIIHGSLPTEAEYDRLVKRELGEESRDLYESIYELAKEIQPKFLFFELRPRLWKGDKDSDTSKWGSKTFIIKLTRLGYDCRWDTLSAYDVGSPQKRERVYLLARKREEANILLESTNDKQVQSNGRTTVLQKRPFPDNRNITDGGVAKRTPERVAEVKAGIEEICVPQYREAFLRLIGLKDMIDAKFKKEETSEG